MGLGHLTVWEQLEMCTSAVAVVVAETTQAGTHLLKAIQTA